jgi:putative transposase
MEPVGRKSLPHEVPLSLRQDTPVFFITLCAKNRTTDPLTHGEVPAKLLSSIRHQHDQGKWYVPVAVIMPDHVHLLAIFHEEMVKSISDWKQWTSKRLEIEWQRDFFDHRLRSDESRSEKSDYILQNPVRAGLVELWEDWPHVWIAPDSYY